MNFSSTVLESMFCISNSMMMIPYQIKQHIDWLLGDRLYNRLNGEKPGTSLQLTLYAKMSLFKFVQLVICLSESPHHLEQCLDLSIVFGVEWFFTLQLHSIHHSDHGVC